MSVKFIDYNTMEDTYTVVAACELLGRQKEQMKQKCEQYDVKPTRNEIGEGVFSKYDIRRLHNLLYYEDRERKDAWDPWA